MEQHACNEIGVPDDKKTAGTDEEPPCYDEKYVIKLTQVCHRCSLCQFAEVRTFINPL